jgi:ADP-heptose:LPS heptosyltransferase
LKVGLCWAGNPNHDNDRNRSLDFELLRPLLEMPRIDFISLQVGSGAEVVPADSNMKQSLGNPVDFLDTARLVATLDLVISIDSSVAHLTGALGQAVWVLLPYAPDWRWLLGRDDSPWYPNAALYRQQKPGDWSAPIREISKKIDGLSGSN